MKKRGEEGFGAMCGLIFEKFGGEGPSEWGGLEGVFHSIKVASAHHLQE